MLLIGIDLMNGIEKNEDIEIFFMLKCWIDIFKILIMWKM